MAKTKAQRRWQSKRAGRPRTIDARHPCGQPVDKPAVGPIIPPEALDRRAEAIGGIRGTEHDGRAGVALGRMLINHKITRQQFRAANRFSMIWRQCLSMRGIPARGMVKADPAPAIDESALTPDEALELEQERVRKADDFRKVEQIVKGCQCGSGAMNALGDLLFREIEPETETRLAWVRRSLDALADHFGYRSDEVRKAA